MKKKILSVIVAAVVAGVAVVAMPMTSASAANQGIRFNPNDASGDVAQDTALYAEPSESSQVIMTLAKGTLLDEEGKVTDSKGNEWINVKKHNSSDNVTGYIKASSFARFLY